MSNEGMTKPTRKEFASIALNQQGSDVVHRIRRAFHDLLEELELNGVCGADGREMALVRTKLEEASFFAVKAACSREHHQQKAAP